MTPTTSLRGRLAPEADAQQVWFRTADSCAQLQLRSPTLAAEPGGDAQGAVSVEFDTVDPNTGESSYNPDNNPEALVNNAWTATVADAPAC